MRTEWHERLSGTRPNEEKGSHIAVVCDEYGDMTGILTPTDILENLLGRSECGIKPCTEPDTWSADARTPFYDVLRFFGRTNLYEPARYSTLGGFLLENMRHMPSVGETCRWGGFIFTVEAVDGARIESVGIRLCGEALE